jgi:hypothetical protein
MARFSSAAGRVSLTLGTVLAVIGQAHAGALQDYVLEAFAAEERETHKRTEFSFRRGDKQTAYSIKRVLPDRLHMLVRSESGEQEVFIIGNLMFSMTDGTWQVGPAPSRPGSLQSVVDFLDKRLECLAEGAPMVQEGVEYRSFRATLNWRSGAGRNVGSIDLTIDTRTKLPRTVTFRGDCSGVPCAFEQVFFYDAAIRVEPPIL